MERYWIMIGGMLKGPLEVAELVAFSGFLPHSPVSRDGEGEWKEASDFPSIVRYIQTGVAPTSTPLPVPGEERLKFNKQNWRQAIVDTDTKFEEFKTVSYSGDYSAARVQPLKSGRGPVKTSRPKPVVLESSWRFNSRQSQKVLLLFLGVALAGLYKPAMSQWPTALDGMTESAEPAASAAPHRFNFHWHRVKRQGLSEASRIVGKNAETHALPKGEVVESDSSPLGNGMLLQTVTTAREINGVRVYKTRTLMVPARRSKHHP